MAKSDKPIQQLLYELLADKVGSVDPHKIFYAKKIESGQHAGKFACYLSGKKLTPNEVTNLKQEVLLLEKMLLWPVFTETLRHEAQLRMFEKSKTTEDMFFGKALLHSVGVFETIVSAIKNAHID